MMLLMLLIVFSTHFSVFGYAMKHSSSCFIYYIYIIHIYIIHIYIIHIYIIHVYIIYNILFIILVVRSPSFPLHAASTSLVDT